MASRRVVILDPAGRHGEEISRSAAAVGLAPELVTGAAAAGAAARADLVLVAPGAIGALGDGSAATVSSGVGTESGAPRWVFGDAADAGKLAGAAVASGAQGVIILPIAPATIAAIVAPDPPPATEQARLRSLLAVSMLDDDVRAPLAAVASAFAADDCIVWWRDGEAMAPRAARDTPDDGYAKPVAAAARIAAATGATAIVPAGAIVRSVIAAPMRAGPNEVAGLIAIVTDRARRFGAAERTDLRALASRLTRELGHLAGYRRLVAEDEKLRAGSLHDPLTSALTRAAFEQAVANEVAAASRRSEPLALVLIDIVGLRKINLAHGHRAGDEVLAQIAGRLRATVRGNDPMGRPGGDELAVLLVGANKDQGALVAKKILSRVQTEPVQVDDTDVAVQLRVVLTEIGPGERSGEAALARCYGALRGAPIGDARVVESNDRSTSDADVGADTGSLSAGTILGGTYRVVHELSRGAMGVVYRGEDLGLGRPVAIKVLRSDLASDRDLVDRFRAEAGLLASLHHKNLVQVYALGEHAGEVYFVMELVEGQPLSEVLRATLERREWFPLEAVAQIALEIGDALDAMHALGVIHRDVKPANVLLDRERDRAVLVDVGVAVKAGDQRDAAGTPGFAAPESFLEQEGTAATDVYGLAATMYCAITGRPPFGSGPAPQVVQRQLNDPLVPPSQLRPSISSAVDAVLAKALTPNPKKRWANASTFALALGRALTRGTGEMKPLAPAPELSAAEAVLRPTEGIDTGEMFSVRSLRPTGSEKPVIDGRVRAAHLRVLSRIIQHHIGESGMAKLRNERPELATVLAPTLAPLAWVSLGELVGALDQAREVLPGAQLPRKVGRGTMSATFSRLFGADPASLAAETVLAALPTFWSRYHDWGPATVAVRPGVAEVVLDGFAGSTDVCALVVAELERIVELTGARAVSSSHARCRCLGAQSCEYRLHWTR